MTAVSLMVIGLNDLTRGDHMKWKRPAGHDHHAIVESIGDDGHGNPTVN